MKTYIKRWAVCMAIAMIISGLLGYYVWTAIFGDDASMVAVLVGVALGMIAGLIPAPSLIFNNRR